MKFEELKKDSYIHWVASRMLKGWNTFGKVVKLTKDEVIFLTFDDFKKTTILKNGGEALKEEISLANKDEVLEYIQDTIGKLTIEKTKLEVNYNKQLREIDDKISKLNKFLNLKK